jgi:diacylglycerol kinase family enzyme
MLDLCVFSPNSVADVVSIIGRAWRKDFRPHPRMRFFKARRILLDSQPPRAVQADGDVIGVTPIEIDVAPGAATFLLPRP